MMKREVRTRRRGVAAAIVTLAIVGAYAVSLERGDREYSATAFRTADLIVDSTFKLGSGSAWISQKTGSPNGSVGSAKGAIIVDTSTPALWQNTTGSNVWVAFGSGGGSGGGFTTAGWGLIGSGATVSLDSTGCSSGYVLTWNGTTWVCAAQTGSGGGSAAFVSIAQTATTGTPNLTTLGTSDWLAFQFNTPSNSAAQFSRKLTGGRQIERPVWMNTNMSNIATTNRNQAVTWTASDNLSQGSAGAGFLQTELAFSAAGTNFGFVTSAPSSTIARTFTIYVANFNETDAVTCSAVLADHEYAQQNVSFTMSAIDNRTVTVVYNSQQATRINVWCFITAGPNTNLGWLAMWLA